MKISRLLAFVIAFLSLTACYSLGLLPTATPLPQPTELATTPPPPGSQPGGLEGIFRSLVSIDGEADSRCYKLFRFYPDGLALYAGLACFDRSPAGRNGPDLERWFERGNRQLARGDYFLLGERIWVRIVTYDAVHETVYLRSFQGEICEDEMVLQEPAQRYYTGVPSELTQPVLEYVRLSATAQLPAASAAPQGPSPTSCHVAGFRILWRPSVTISGGQVEYRILTDPGETCTLRYTTPDGRLSQAPGTGAIAADAQGVCRWVWEVGDLKGRATVTVSIDEISQDFWIELR